MLVRKVSSMFALMRTAAGENSNLTVEWVMSNLWRVVC